MSFLSELFATSAAVVALLFTVLGIASSLQEKNRYFAGEVLRYCRYSFWLLYAVCIVSLFSFLAEEAETLGIHLELGEFQWNAQCLLVFYGVLSIVFVAGLFLIGLAVKELLKRLSQRSP